MQNLLVSIIQADLVWENRKENLLRLEEVMQGIEKTDLVILPEMFTTGFTMEVEKFYEEMGGETVEWMKQLAQKKRAAILGTIIIKEGGCFYNRALWVTPGGSVDIYDKRHLYTMGGEHISYTAGKQKLVVEWKGWKICPLICYDLRFPVWSRNNDDYDLLIYMANWPSPRHHVWKNLLVARAIENQAYVAGVNRVGVDGMKLNYLGDSALVDAKGYAEFLGAQEAVKTIDLSYAGLINFRKKFPLLPDRDHFEIRY